MDVRTAEYTVEEYDRLVEIGIFTEDSPIELIEGRISILPRKTPQHSAVTTILNSWFQRRRSNAFRVGVHDPIVLSDYSEPEPDIVLARPLADRRIYGHPRSEDIYLIIEIADRSLVFDRGRKANLYARAGIADYWVVNVLDSVIEVFRDPSPDGYKDVRTYRPGESIALLAFPDLALAVSEIVS